MGSKICLEALKVHLYWKTILKPWKVLGICYFFDMSWLSHFSAYNAHFLHAEGSLIFGMYNTIEHFILVLKANKIWWGEDPGFHERGFIFINVWGFMLILSHFSKISRENEIILTKLFNFHRIFENGGRGRGFKGTPWMLEPPEPPLDPPLKEHRSYQGPLSKCLPSRFGQVDVELR